MKSALAILASFLLLASVATAQPAPSGPPPTFKTLAGADKEKGTFRLTEMKPVLEEYDGKRVRVIDGVPVFEVVAMTRTVYERLTTTHDATKNRFMTPDGKQLPIDEVWKRLKDNTVVAVSSDGNTPGEAYLRALSPETLVIIPPTVPPTERVRPIDLPVKKKNP